MVVKCKMRFGWLFMNPSSVWRSFFSALVLDHPRHHPQQQEAIKSLIKISCSIIIWWQNKAIKIILRGSGFEKILLSKAMSQHKSTSLRGDVVEGAKGDFNEISQPSHVDDVGESLIKLKLNTKQVISI